jgi:phage protein U
VHPGIETALSALLASMRNREVLDLVVGEDATTGIYAGSYVLEKIPHQVTKHLPNGRIAAVELTLELLEWTDDPELVLAPPAPAVRKKKVTAPATSAQSKVDPQTGLIGTTS